MKTFKKLFMLSLATLLLLGFCGCEKNHGPKEYEYTTEKASKTLIPSLTYGCDIYTADLPSLKKMSGVVYRGEDFGEIPDEKTAVEAAVAAVFQVYGNAFDGYEPLVVSFNDRAGCWLVHGTPQDNRNTGVTFVGIRKATGEVVMLLKNPKEK